MLVDKKKYKEIVQELKPQNILLVAVSKTKSIEAIKELYALGQKDFGENYVQELGDKQALLPGDIRWHFIGHLQTNKVKYIAPFVHLIHGVDSLKLLKEINKQGKKCNRVIEVLLQIHIAREETKFGLDEEELSVIIKEIDAENGRENMKNVKIVGLMGMASFSYDVELIRQEFRFLKTLFDKYAALSTPNCQLQTLSMGMSSDYQKAIDEGSNLVRIGSLIFGSRNKE